MTRFTCCTLIAVSLGGCCAPKPYSQSTSQAQKSGDSRPYSAQKAETPSSRTGRTPMRPSNLGSEWAWTGQALPTGDQTTSVLLLEKIAPVEVSAGTPYESTIRVTNISTATSLADVRVTDRVKGAGYQFESSTPAAERTETDLKWNLGHMDPGESKTIAVRGRTTGQAPVMSCSSADFSQSACLTTNVVSPKLEVLTFAPAEAVPCDDIPVRFVVKNPGSGRATNVRVTPELPESWTVNGRRDVTFDAGTLRGGEQREFTAVAKASKTGSFSTKAKATADGGLTAEGSAPTSVGKPRLEVTQTASLAQQIYDRDTQFTIVVTNKGDGVARDVTLREEYSGVERMGAMSNEGSASGGAVTWRIGTLAPGASRTVTWTASRASGGTMSGTATAQGWCAEAAVSAAAKTTYIGIPAVLLEVVDGADPVQVGGTATYTITVVNQGSAADSEVSVKCSFESAVEFVSASGATNGTASAGEVTFAPLATIAPKEAVKWFVTVRGIKVGDTRFKVTLNTHETGRPIEETEATRVFE